ncbi:MAG: type II toxin-antitoxin system VapB family antitoxin [Nitrospira sp. LK70]|nr:type II toxin-antitoxin system VapB family antitoxin [Nitrospira sp. LK70]
MRTNLTIDDSLMRQAMQVTGLSTKKAVVEEGLRLLIKVKGQEGLRSLRGKISLAVNVRELDNGKDF